MLSWYNFFVQALVICEIFQAFLTLEQFLFQGLVNFPTIVACKRMFIPKDTLKDSSFLSVASLDLRLRVKGI